MQTNAAHFPMMTLYSLTGARKYLTASERTRFHDALPVLENPKERSFVEMIYWTGCRPCEALSMRVFQILLDDYFTIIQSAKKRGKQKGNHFRPVPLPVPFTQALDAAHNIRIRQQQGFDTGNADLLWTFSRTKGWRLVNTVMKEAGIAGIHACARGLRHTMGTHGAIKQIPQTKMQSWLGHADLSTTAIYMNAIGPEDHAIAARMW